MVERRRYLDESFVLQVTHLDAAMQALRPLAHAKTSPLPARMRNQLARMVVKLSSFARELRSTPDSVRYEREQKG